MPKSRISPHDRFIKSMMSNQKVIHEFFETHLPQTIKELIDFSTIVPQKESFVDDKLRLQMADLLYAVNIQGKPGYIYFLVEHQSSPDRLLPFRLLKYMTAIMDAHLKKTGETTLPFVYPLVLYTGQKPYRYSLDLFTLFGTHQELARETLMQPCHLIDLTQVTDEELKQYTYFGTMALIAKHIHDADVLPFLKDVLSLLKELERQGQDECIYVTLSYIVQAGEVSDKEAFISTLKTLEFINEEKVMTIAEQFRQEGFSKGIEKGKLEAAQEIALNFLKLGINIDDIAQATSLSVTEIETLKNRFH